MWSFFLIFLKVSCMYEWIQAMAYVVLRLPRVQVRAARGVHGARWHPVLREGLPAAVRRALCLLPTFHLRQGVAGRRQPSLPPYLRTLHQVWGPLRRWRGDVLTRWPVYSVTHTYPLSHGKGLQNINCTTGTQGCKGQPCSDYGEGVHSFC